MTEPKFTPGPWHIGYGKTVESLGGGDFFAIGLKTDPDWTAICLLSPADSVSNIDKANAHLIAAAPDLYEALDGLLADITEYQEINFLGGENNHWQVRARAALAKARGER